MNTQTPAAIAERRVDALAVADYWSRRDALRAELVERGLSAVATAELRLLEETCEAIADEEDRNALAEIDAENGWLRAAEAGYPGYDYDPNEGIDPIIPADLDAQWAALRASGWGAS